MGQDLTFPLTRPQLEQRRQQLAQSGVFLQGIMGRFRIQGLCYRWIIMRRMRC